MTALELDAALKSNGDDIIDCGSIAFLQCVGSRIPERPYCSKVCCTHSVKSALTLKARNPKMEIYILYRDIRTYGLRENLYRTAKSTRPCAKDAVCAAPPAAAAQPCWTARRMPKSSRRSALLPCKDVYFPTFPPAPRGGANERI